MIRLYEIRMELDESISDLKEKCERLLNSKIKDFVIVKKSIDARRKQDVFYSCTVDCEVAGTIKPRKKLKFKSVNEIAYTFPQCEANQKVVIVGSGPAGLFSALCLARCGIMPIVLERGSDVEQRVKKVNSFFLSGNLDRNTNVQFGEGGAGTFSDGKLNTGINDARIKFVLSEFVKFGASEDILIDSAPHIGTDVLRTVVKNIRNEIIRLGGRVLFDTRLDGLICDKGKIIAVEATKDGKKDIINCDKLILAIGHSARDTIKMLHDSGLKMEKKMFSVGVRIEHEQKNISNALYGTFSDKLPPAPYKLWTHLKDGSSLYSFCMCPGGFVINSASESNRIVTNGMSEKLRSGNNANSALLVNVKYSKTDDVFEGMSLQEKIESDAFVAGGGNYKMPVQLLGDFLKNQKSVCLGSVEPTVKPGYCFSNIGDLLPDYITETIRVGILDFEHKIKGFTAYDAVLTAPETRSSSPIRILRDKETLETNIKGVYSAGEGGGHAGGITSSAVDGIKVAESIIKRLLR